MDAIPPPTVPVAPLPWEWFEFSGRVRAFLKDQPASPRQTWTVTVDHRPVAFKLFRRDSSRPLLILLHGMGLTIASFHGVSGYLFQTHDLALVDYSSLSGTVEENRWPAEGVAVKVMADAVWRIADAVGAPAFSLGGNSLGGGMCLVAALLRPRDARLKSIVLSNPACYPQQLPKMYRLARIPMLGELLMAITPAERLIGGVEHIGYVDKTKFDARLRAHYLSTMSLRKNRFRLMDMIRHLPAGERDLTMALHLPRLGEISQPVLIAWGEKDPLLVEGTGKRLASALRCGRYAGFSDLSHMPHEEAPDRIGPLWADFLRECKNDLEPIRITRLP